METELRRLLVSARRGVAEVEGISISHSAWSQTIHVTPSIHPGFTAQLETSDVVEFVYCPALIKRSSQQTNLSQRFELTIQDLNEVIAPLVDQIPLDSDEKPQILIRSFVYEQVSKEPYTPNDGLNGWDTSSNVEIVSKNQNSINNAEVTAPVNNFFKTINHTSESNISRTLNRQFSASQAIHLSFDYASGGSAPRDVIWQVRVIFQRVIDGVFVIRTQDFSTNIVSWSKGSYTAIAPDVPDGSILSSITFRRLSGGSGIGYVGNIKTTDVIATVQDGPYRLKADSSAMVTEGFKTTATPRNVNSSGTGRRMTIQRFPMLRGFSR